MVVSFALSPLLRPTSYLPSPRPILDKKLDALPICPLADILIL